METWRVEYDNDTGNNDESYHQWWTVTNDIRSFTTRLENNAKWLQDVLNSLDRGEKPNMKIKIINDEGRIWCLNILNKGDKYGLDNCLTHEDEKPVVEFYDCRYEHTNLGQFVSRYYVHTLLEGGNRGELDLCGYEPSWKISQKGMDRVRAFLMEVVYESN